MTPMPNRKIIRVKDGDFPVRGAICDRGQIGRRKNYQWIAEDVIKGVKPEYEEDAETIKYI